MGRSEKNKHEGVKIQIYYNKSSKLFALNTIKLSAEGVTLMLLGHAILNRTIPSGYRVVKIKIRPKAMSEREKRRS